MMWHALGILAVVYAGLALWLFASQSNLVFYIAAMGTAAASRST